MIIRGFIVLIMLSWLARGSAQEIDPCESYIKSIEAISANKEAPLKIGFDYDLSDGLMETLENSDVFKMQEIVLIKKSLENEALGIKPQCHEKLKLLLQQKNQQSVANTNNYNVVNFSKLILVPEQKAYLFLEILDYREGTVAGGGSVLEEYVLTDGAWSLTSKRILEMN